MHSGCSGMGVSIVDNLAAGISEDEIMSAYPILKNADIRAAMAYAAELARDRYVALAV